MTTSNESPDLFSVGAADLSSSDPHHERRWLILAVLGLAQLLVVLDMTVINVALPSAQRTLHFATADREWVVTAYALAFGSLLPLGGRLSDLFGRKWTFIGGAAGFALASAAGGAAPSFGVLIGARVGQGVFAALLAPAAFSLINVTFVDPKERDKAIGAFAGISALAGALGLLIGGALTAYVSWRWAMFVNIFFAGIAVVGGSILLTNQGRSKHLQLDIPGTAAASVGLFAIVFGFAKAETNGWGATITVVALAAGVALLTVFLFWQSRAKHPLVPLHIIGERSRGASYLAISAAGLCLFSIFLFTTYFLQDQLGYSAMHTGLAFLPLTLVFIPVAGVTQANLPKLNRRLIYSIGLLIAAGGLVWLAQINPGSHYLGGVLPGLVIVPLGLGVAAPAAYNNATVGVGAQDAGAAGAMVDVSQQIGAAMGIAVLSTLAATATTNALRNRADTARVIAQATVHGYSTAFWAAAIILGVLALVSGSLVTSHVSSENAGPVPEPAPAS